MTAMETRIAEKRRKECMRSYLDNHRAMNEARDMARLQSYIVTPQMEERRTLPPLNQNLRKRGASVVDSLSLQDYKPEDEFCKLLEKFESAVHSFTTEFLESQLYEKIDTAPSSVPKTYNLKMKIKLMNHLLLKFDDKTRKLLQEEVLSTICHLVCHQRRMYRTDDHSQDIRTCKPCEARCTCNEDNLVHLTSLIKRLKRHYRHRLYEKKLTCGELENDDSKCSQNEDSPNKETNRPKSPRVVPYVHYRNVVNQIFQSNCCNRENYTHASQDLYESLDTEFPPSPYDRKTLYHDNVNGKHQKKLVSCYTTDQSDSDVKNCKCENDFDVFNYPGWYGLHSPEERRLIACKINAQLKKFNTTPPFKLRPSEEAVSDYRKMLVDRVATFQSFEDSLLSYTMMSKCTPLMWCGNGPDGQPVFFPKDGRAGDCCSSCFLPGLPTPLSNLFQSWSRRLPDCSCCQEAPGNRWSRGRDGNRNGRKGNFGTGMKKFRRHRNGSRSTTGSNSSLWQRKKKRKSGKKKRKKHDNYTDTDDTFSSAGVRDKEKGKGNRRKKKKRSPEKSGTDSSSSIGRQRRKGNKGRNKKEQGKGKKHRKKSNSPSPKNLKNQGATGSSSMMNASQNTSTNPLKQKRFKNKSGKGDKSDKSGGSNRNRKKEKGKGRGNGHTENDDNLKSKNDLLKGSHKKRPRGSDNEDPDEKRLSVLTNAELEKRLVQALKSGVPNPDQEAIKRILDKRKQSKQNALKTSSLSSLGSAPDKDYKNGGKSNPKQNGKSNDRDSQLSTTKDSKIGKGGKNQKSKLSKSSQTSGENRNDNDNNSETGSRGGKGSVSSSTRGKGGDRMDSFTETEDENDPSKFGSPGSQDKAMQKDTTSNSKGKGQKNPNARSGQGKSGKSGSSNKNNEMTDSKRKLKHSPGSKNMDSQTNYKNSAFSPSENNSDRSRPQLDRLGIKPNAAISAMGIPGSKNAKSRFKDYNNTGTDDKAVVRNKSMIRVSHFLPHSSEAPLRGAPKFKNRIPSRSTPDSSIKSSSFGGGSNSTRGYGSKNRNQGRTPNNTRRGQGISPSSSIDEARRNRNNNRMGTGAGSSANEDDYKDQTGADEDRGKSPAELQWKHATTSHLQGSDSRRSTSARKRTGNDKGSGKNGEKKTKVRFPQLKNKLLWGYVKPKPMKNESITWRGMYDSESSKRVGWENADDGKAGGGGGKMIRDMNDKHRIHHVYMSRNGLRKTTPQDPDWNGVILLPSDDIPKSPVKLAFPRIYSAGSGVDAPRKEHRDSRHTQSLSEVGSRSRHLNSPVVDARPPGQRSNLRSGGSGGGAGGDSRPDPMDRYSGTRLPDQVRHGHVGRRDSSYMRSPGASRRIPRAFPSESVSYDKYLLDNKKRKSYLDIEVETPIDLNSPQENFFWVPLGKYSWEMRNIKVWKSKVLNSRENLGSKEYMQIFPEIKISSSFLSSNVDTTSHLSNVVPPTIPQTSSSCQNPNLICNHCLLDACCCCCLWS